jgi:DNA-binding beta-propeller fold protein YncE
VNLAASKFWKGALSSANVALVFGACGCAPKEEVHRTWDSYSGDAPFPNRRAKIDLPSGPVGIVTNSGSDTLSFLALPEDGSPVSVIASPPVGRDPVDVDGPHHLAVDRAGGFIYTALSYPTPETTPGPHASHGASSRFGWVEKLALTDARPVGQVRVDTNPGDIVMSDDAKRVVVTHFDRTRAQTGTTLDEKRAELMLIDPTTLVLKDSPDPKSVRVCVAPHGTIVSAGAGDTAFVACYGEDVLAIVDLTSPGLATERIPLEGGSTQPGSPTLGPYSVAISPDGALIAVGCLESHEVRLFEIGTRKFRPGSLPLQGAAFFPAWSADGKLLFAPSQSPDAIVAFDVAAGTIVHQRTFGPECGKPHEVVRSPSNNRLYVVCEGDHVAPGAILGIDPSTFETKSETKVGVYPDRVVLIEGGGAK